jgi:hypothetical protein
MPPTTPPDGTYSSTLGPDYSSWDGSFTYTAGAISYTRTGVTPNQTLSSSNTAQGNAMVFTLDDGTTSVTLTSASFKTLPNGGVEYKGSAHSGPMAGQDGWTATQGT